MSKQECYETEAPQTLGQYRVGSELNPSGNEWVDRLKRAAAAFIDECQAARRVFLYDDAGIQPAEGESAVDFEKRQVKHFDKKGEQRRLLNIAEDQVESAAMFAVKAVTKRERKGDYGPGLA